MFSKKACRYCGEKIGNNYSFCPHCGNPSKKSSKQEDWGMLGKDDYVNEQDQSQNPFFGGISNNMLNKIFASTMKMLEKEMKKGATRQQKTSSQPNVKTNFRLSINGQEINFDDQGSMFQQPVKSRSKEQKPTKQAKLIKLTKEKQKKFVKLKKKEPLTHIRRLADKVIYEINMPGVRSIKDISITRLENSIEIKAIAKDKAYQKLIPISLPIIEYDLSKGKLILELEAKN
ncbi:zinc ribbon domain-containing protein [Nanoarchaeota archaeon]